MALQDLLTTALKDAMKAKDTIALESLRAIKSAILLAKTEKGGNNEISEQDEIKILQRLVKQRQESANLYQQQNRNDLAEQELAQIEVISKFLPEQLSVEKVLEIVTEIVEKIGASGMKDMGKVMGEAGKILAGQVDGKILSEVVKKVLS